MARHEILSVSMCSNIPEISLPYCFINEGDPSLLVDHFMAYLNKISDAVYSILKNVYKDVFDSLEDTLETVKANELTNVESCCDVINNDDDDDVDISIVTSKDIYKLIVSFKEFLKALPVIVFHSRRYDLNLIKKYIIP